MSYPELVQAWRDAGMAAGDTVLLHSNTWRTASRLLKQRIRPEMPLLLQTFLDALGPEGTLLLSLIHI